MGPVGDFLVNLLLDLGEGVEDVDGGIDLVVHLLEMLHLLLVELELKNLMQQVLSDVQIVRVFLFVLLNDFKYSCEASHTMSSSLKLYELKDLINIEVETVVLFMYNKMRFMTVHLFL